MRDEAPLIEVRSMVKHFGSVIALSPLADPTQQRLSFLVSCLFGWPLAALVMRNLYGDLTGRLVIRDLSPPLRRRRRR